MRGRASRASGYREFKSLRSSCCRDPVFEQRAAGRHRLRRSFGSSPDEIRVLGPDTVMAGSSSCAVPVLAPRDEG